VPKSVYPLKIAKLKFHETLQIPGNQLLAKNDRPKSAENGKFWQRLAIFAGLMQKHKFSETSIIKPIMAKN
jgi:hypothetical protein